MPVCIMVSVRYLNRTGIGRLIGVPFYLPFLAHADKGNMRLGNKLFGVLYG